MLYEKLTEIQAELKAPKDKYNSFGKYKYRSAEGILEALKPILKEKNITMFISDEVLNIGERYYVKATVTLREGEEEIKVSALAREDETKKGMDGSQITGTASSYARKYALNGMFAIDDTKDADTDEYRNQINNAPTDAKATELELLIKKAGTDPKAVCKKYKVDSLSELSDEVYKKIKAQAEMMIETAESTKIE